MNQITIDKSEAIRRGAICLAYAQHRPADLGKTAVNAIQLLAETCALLTSAVKAEREEGKARVREYRTVGVSHAKPSAVE